MASGKWEVNKPNFIVTTTRPHVCCVLPKILLMQLKTQILTAYLWIWWKLRAKALINWELLDMCTVYTSHQSDNIFALT